MSQRDQKGRFAYPELDRVLHERARLGILTCLLSATSSCEPVATSVPPSPRPSGAAQARLELHASDAEVWAWSARIQGALAGTGTLEECAIRVGSDAFPAAIEQQRFSADVPLLEGENEIVVLELHDAPKVAEVSGGTQIIEHPNVGFAAADGTPIRLDQPASFGGRGRGPGRGNRGATTAPASQPLTN